MTDTDRPVYVAVRYVYHDKDTAPYEPPPGTMTPKEIVDRAMHPSVARTTIWCPGVANPEPGPTDLDEEADDIGWWGERGRYLTDSDSGSSDEQSVVAVWQERNRKVVVTRPSNGEMPVSSWTRFERSRKFNVIPLTPGQQQAHYGHSMAEDIPDGGDDVA